MGSGGCGGSRRSPPAGRRCVWSGLAGLAGLSAQRGAARQWRCSDWLDGDRVSSPCTGRSCAELALWQARGYGEAVVRGKPVTLLCCVPQTQARARRVVRRGGGGRGEWWCRWLYVVVVEVEEKEERRRVRQGQVP